MSTRNLGLLTATTVAALAFGGFAGPALAAAAPTPPGDDKPSSHTAVRPPTMPEMPAMPAMPAQAAAQPAADGHDLSACADGECDVVVRDGDEIRLDERFKLEPIRVDVHGSRVTFRLESNNAHMVTSVDASQHATVHWKGLTLKPRMTEDGKIALALSHRDAGKH
ncbi:hypothetical protein BJF79_45790 [Actinomadura sp. CNU-125]|uniref:hypothetical protein n=1 Tax=Actinomadura sp. CNU-125 TaxID=1904961 RepID=UPI000962598F|nr:hypothetical protein [Actinomadura sp. CNU-125]OLT23759.1 hypothetical protein BJF79_45790 [Actinomadura sp. CNU-125]